VRRDRAGTSVILILLAALGGIGLVAYLWAALSALSEGVWGFLAAGILVLLFISLIAGVITFHRARYDPNQWGVGRVIVRTLVLTGGLVGLFCVLGLALFLLLFIVCWTSRTPGGKLIGRTPDRIQENNNAANYMYAVKAQVVDFRFCPCRRAHLHKLPGRDCESARDG
jgi:hypothetical protein